MEDFFRFYLFDEICNVIGDIAVVEQVTIKRDRAGELYGLYYLRWMGDNKSITMKKDRVEIEFVHRRDYEPIVEFRNYQRNG